MKLQKKALGTGSTCDQNRFVLVTPFSATVMDNLTGLEWETKGDGTFNDKDDTYALFNAVFTFLAGNFGDGLNHPSSDSCGFAAKCDWRLPTVAELQTILSEPFPCTTSPCIDAIFGPTAATDHWSATTLADNPDYAWGVFFGTVRGGL